MKLFFTYIKEKRRWLIAGLLFSIIFFVTFFLYHLPIAAVLYPVVLCTITGSALLFADFQKEKRRHEQLRQIHNFTDAMIREFPQPEGLTDADYQRIIRLLCEEQKDFRGKAENHYADMVDYYTVWAHQIKTPIAAMHLTLQNEDSALSRKLASDLFRVEQYVEMVLMFLKLESPTTDYVIRQYDLDTIVRQTVKKFAGEFINRKLKLNYEPVQAQVITDEKWLSFVVEQILSNALKYTPSGSISITLTPEKRLCIRDTGIGIAGEDLPRIFEKGYTGYNGRTDKKASGIGLYLCKRICGNLGHSIWAESAVDEGTCITIDLSQRDIKHE